MKNEINAVLENMTTTIPEPEDYTGEDGLLYCGKCRKPKEAYFAPDKAAIFGRDRHPAECDCQRTAREEREAAEKRVGAEYAGTVRPAQLLPLRQDNPGNWRSIWSAGTHGQAD